MSFILTIAGASNWDKESAEASLAEIQTKGIVDENKSSITMSLDSPDFSIMQDAATATPNVVSFVTFCTPQPFHSKSFISPAFSSKLDSLEVKQYDKLLL